MDADHLTVTQQDHVAIAVLIERQANMDTKLDQILDQTTKTNGRVTTLEAWRSRAQGAWFAISVAGPVVTALIVSELVK